MASLDGGELLELNCPICYGDQGDSGYSTLVCGHVFHEKCLAQSLKLKKECPSCRCPARPIDTGRRDAGSQPKCPCKTGQPLRLYHLQRPRSGSDAPSPMGPAAGASALDVAVASQRESRLREALQEERQRVVELELGVVAQQAEVDKALEKAERRKLRLAALEKDHRAATARLGEDKARLEARERELSEDLTRVRQALHSTRMDLEKSRAAVYERDDAVMRLKRELAMQRARAGGAAALQPREMAELLGERKEDWQAVYSMKVEELRRAMDTSAELRAEAARSRTEAEARVSAERLAGAERVKAAAQERDDVKRELMELEYKLHEALQRLRDLQPAATNGAFTASKAAAATATAAGTAGPRTLLQHQQQRHLQDGDNAGRSVVGAAGAGSAGPTPTGRESGTSDVGVDDDDGNDLEALALMAMSCGDGDQGDEGVDGCDDGWDLEAGAGGKRSAQGGGGSGPNGASARRGTAAGGADNELEYDDTPYELAAGVPPSKRRRQGCLDLVGGAADGPAGSLYDNDDDDDQQLLVGDADPVDGDLMPVLPRAFSGLFPGAGGGRHGRPPPARGAVGGGAGGADGSGLGAAPYQLSFAAKAGATAGVFARSGVSGGSLIVEGPDGRGGTTRFPLTSSFAHNTGKPATGKAAGRGARSGGPGRPAAQPVAASGRIDAFLRPLAQPNRR